MRIAKQLTLPFLLLVLLLLLASCDITQDVPSVDTSQAATETTAAPDVTEEESETEPHEHTYSAATCIKPGTCACGATSGNALGHDLAEATCSMPPICNRCGVAEGQALGHNYSAATCTEAKVCSRCNMQSGTALGHNYTAATCTNPKTCERCGETEGAAKGHSYKSTTCTQPETCRYCQRTQGEPMGHNYQDATCTRPMFCPNCGSESGRALGHTYVEHKCIRCNEVDPESLPVRLDEIHSIGSSTYDDRWLHYRYENNFKDAYGEWQTRVHAYVFKGYDTIVGDVEGDWVQSEHALSKKYTTFKGTISTLNGTSIESRIKVYIYVDGILGFYCDDYSTSKGPLDFEIDVTGGSVLKICVSRNSSLYTTGVAIYNTQLYKN